MYQARAIELPSHVAHDQTFSPKGWILDKSKVTHSLYKKNQSNFKKLDKKGSFFPPSFLKNLSPSDDCKTRQAVSMIAAKLFLKKYFVSFEVGHTYFKLEPQILLKS